MGLKLNGATSGSIEIDVPAVAGTDTSITIPAKNGGTFIVEESTGNIDLGPLDINGSASDDSVNIDSSGRLLVGETSSVGANSAMLQVGGGNGSTTFSAVSIISGNDEVAGHIMLDSSGSNSLGIHADPDNLRGSTNLSFYTDGTERMRITDDARVGVNTTNFTNGRLIVTSDGSAVTPFVVRETASGTGSVNTVGFFRGASVVGTISTTGSATAYNTSSDYRLKENVVDLDGAIDRVKQLAPKRFNFIADADTTVDGFLAHEAQTVVPEAVTGTHDEVDDEGNPVMQGIDQSKLVPLLTSALQEAIGKIEALETANASLEARLTALEGGAA